MLRLAYARTIAAASRSPVGMASHNLRRLSTPPSQGGPPDVPPPPQASSVAPSTEASRPNEKADKPRGGRRRAHFPWGNRRLPIHPNQRGANLDSQRGIELFLDASGTGTGAARTGRSWRASELRLKSFDDLHQLWFVLVRERDALLTERAWCKSNGRHWTNGQSNLYKVHVSMSRVKAVLGERITALKRKRARDALDAETDGESLDSQSDDKALAVSESRKDRGKSVSKSGLPLSVSGRL